MRQTVAHGAAVDAELNTLFLADFRGAAPARSQFVRLCYKNCPFVSSGPTAGRPPGSDAGGSGTGATPSQP